jgi:hypothetical protein
MAELPKGADAFKPLTLSGFTIGFPGGVMWTGSQMAASDQEYNGGDNTALYRLTISWSTATLASTTELTDTTCFRGDSIVQPWIMGNKVVGGNSCQFHFGYWNNTSGEPNKFLNQSIAPSFTGGQTVSR